ncbi:imelysin family protein [Dyadobacter sp. NIV53]|uniref:imelysin family protein n=1 Tax=Dyadobacter sp. NIV53 TaxID=2861765 RepID=UPI001C86A10F|nr:imelysin family protein [Dyadobacter sp. NIV53]
MTKKLWKKAGIFLLAGLSAWACSDSETNVTQPDLNKDRKAVLTNLADNVIIPSYANFKTKFDVMLAKSQAFTAKPDITTLTEFRSAWVAAYIEWQKSELFDFGPGARNAIRNYYNIYPANVQGIIAYINNPSENLEVTASYDKQGFPALDYMLNGVGKTDAEIITWYTSASDGSKRLAYLTRITGHMDHLIQNVITEWNGNYHEDFITKTGTDTGSPMGELVNGYILHYERYIRSGKIGIPSGAMLNGVAAAEKVEGFYKKDISQSLAQAAHQAVVDFFNGKNLKTGVNGPSLKSYLDGLGAKDSSTGTTLSDMINTQFDASKKKVDALNPNFYEEVLTNNQAMKDTYTEMQKAVRMLKVDMTSAMSITITYTDNDGD